MFRVLQFQVRGHVFLFLQLGNLMAPKVGHQINSTALNGCLQFPVDEDDAFFIK